MRVCSGADPVSGWEYKYGVANPGTKSEDIYGRLLYKGRNLPEEYSHVVTPVGEFYGIKNIPTWEGANSTWLPVGKYPDGKIKPAGTEKDVEYLLNGKDPSFRTIAIKEASSVVSKKPCIAGTFETRPKGIGTDWFYVIKQGLWVNPQKIDEVLKTKLAKTERK